MVQGTRSCIAYHFFRSRIRIGFLMGHDGMLMMVEFDAGPSSVTRSSCEKIASKRWSIFTMISNSKISIQCVMNPHVSWVYNDTCTSTLIYTIYRLFIIPPNPNHSLGVLFSLAHLQALIRTHWCLSENHVCKKEPWLAVLYWDWESIESMLGCYTWGFVRIYSNKHWWINMYMYIFYILKKICIYL